MPLHPARAEERRQLGDVARREGDRASNGIASSASPTGASAVNISRYGTASDDRLERDQAAQRVRRVCASTAVRPVRPSTCTWTVAPMPSMRHGTGLPVRARPLVSTRSTSTSGVESLAESRSTRPFTSTVPDTFAAVNASPSGSCAVQLGEIHVRGDVGALPRRVRHEDASSGSAGADLQRRGAHLDRADVAHASR